MPPVAWLHTSSSSLSGGASLKINKSYYFLLSCCVWGVRGMGCCKDLFSSASIQTGAAMIGCCSEEVYTTAARTYETTFDKMLHRHRFVACWRTERNSRKTSSFLLLQSSDWTYNCTAQYVRNLSSSQARCSFPAIPEAKSFARMGRRLGSFMSSTEVIFNYCHHNFLVFGNMPAPNA